MLLMFSVDYINLTLHMRIAEVTLNVPRGIFNSYRLFALYVFKLKDIANLLCVFCE